MKKYLLLLFALLLLLLAGCGQSAAAPATDPRGEALENPGEVPTEAPTEAPTEPPAFADGVRMWNVDLSGLDAGQAIAALDGRMKTYVLELTLNGRVLSFSAEDMGMALSPEGMAAWCAGGDDSNVVTFQDDAILASISSQADMPAKNAGIEFQGRWFALTREETGTAVDPTEALAAVKAAARELNPTAVAGGEIRETTAAITRDSEYARTALDRANRFLEISLTYTFDTRDGQLNTYTLTRQDIAAVLQFDEDLEPVADQEGARGLAAYLNSRYYIPGKTDWFVTSDGRTIDTEVTYASHVVDMELLREDIAYCVGRRLSGSRPAPYREATQGDMPFGGHYIEIDQNAQTVWLYKGGECILSTPTVTGCRAYGWYTPDGVFAINRKGEHVMLEGETYNSYVRYWMCFLGHSYGLHDASWRDTFGGDIYLKNGSHGCVNLPSEAAAFLFSEIYVGTPVIIYHDPAIVDGTTAPDGL